MKKIALALCFAALPLTGAARDIFPGESPGNRFAVELCTESAGLFSTSLSWDGRISFGDFSLEPNVNMGYDSLGSFQLISSDGYAYRAGETVEGYSMRGGAGLAADFRYFRAGARMTVEETAVGPESFFAFREIAAQAGIRFSGMHLGLECGSRSQNIFAAFFVHAPIYVLPVPLAVFGGIRWTDNLVLNAGLQVWNAGQDLMLSCEIPQGLLQPVDTLLDIGFLKRFGAFEFGVRIKPSLSGNDRYETALAYVPAIN